MKKENVVICPPCGESVAVATKEGQNKENALWPLLPRLTAVLPPQGREMSSAFTLIELLVVVLIIGILAAVAVPQYQKAVEKSRIAEALASLKTWQEAMEVYVLAHGFPAENCSFTGTEAACSLDISFPCEKETANSCKTKFFEYQVWIHPTGFAIHISNMHRPPKYVLGSYNASWTGNKWYNVCMYEEDNAAGQSLCESLGNNWDTEAEL